MKINDITIKVRRFGPLENVSFKLAPMMIFTGMSSLGKSYANYLVYYLMSSICNGKLIEPLFKEDKENTDLNRHVFDLDVFLKELENNAQGFMRKFLGDEELKCEVEFKSAKRTRQVTIEYKKAEISISEREDSRFLHGLQPYELGYNGQPRKTFPSISFVRFYTNQMLQNFILGEYVSNEVILPPGRGAFAGENYSLKSEVASNLNMYNFFFRDYDNGINGRVRFRKEEYNHLPERLMKMTCGGDLYSVEGKQYLQLNNEDRIALSAGASSIKDLSPWLFYLKNMWLVPCSFCMEEPEAHQHPSVTVQIADVMAITMHKPVSNMFHLTTHSDYLIQRLNQLVKLGSIRRKDGTLFKKICQERKLDEHCYLDACDIRAYYFKKGPKGKTIVESLNVTDDGIPMNSFFDVVDDLNAREEYINDAIYRMEKEER